MANDKITILKLKRMSQLLDVSEVYHQDLSWFTYIAQYGRCFFLSNEILSQMIVELALTVSVWMFPDIFLP